MPYIRILTPFLTHDFVLPPPDSIAKTRQSLASAYYFVFAHETPTIMARRAFSVAFAVLIGYMAVFLSASPLLKRTQINMSGATTTVQWSSNGNSINHLRNYHIRADGMLMESKHASNVNGWTNSEMGYNARPDGGLTATLVQLSDAQEDVEIRLFYQRKTPIGTDENTGEMYQMAALRYTLATGW